ncbi:MAG: hypothetical protein OER21_03700 [Gemmatimonadota bacterium]|nr:hypothetical protein [Gemmatimonadota bacterium]
MRARQSVFRLLPVLVALMPAGVPACSRGEPHVEGAIPIALERVALVVQESVPAAPISSENDEFGFARAADLVFDGDRMLVLENGNDRIVRLDEQFRPEAYFGREGAGPGELRGAMSLAVWQDLYAVSEGTNARVSIFRSDGAFVRSLAVPHGFTEVQWGPDGSLFVCSYDDRNYFLRGDTAGPWRPFAERPWDLYPEEFRAMFRPIIHGDVQFVVAGTGAVHVYDEMLGSLVEYSPTGQRVAVRRLPQRILDGLIEQDALVLGDFGGDTRRARPGITDLSVTDDGRLFLLFPNVGAIGLLVDPRTNRAQAIKWPAEADQRYGGFGGVIRNGLFFRHSSDDVRIFKLIPE